MSAQWWLSPKLHVARSQIAGVGLLAVERVEAGETCCTLAGTRMNDEEFRHYTAGRDRYSAFAVDEHEHLVQADDDPTTKGNHSCDPNMWLANAVTVVARRPIAVGEEATIDYAVMTVESTWTMECNCGAPACRGVVTGDDWQRPDLRARYAGHWSPFVERRIERAPRLER